MTFLINIGSSPSFPLMADFTVDDQGVMRWCSNNRVPPSDVVERAIQEGFSLDKAACDAARREDEQKFFAAYRAARANGPSHEEIQMARAAHGAGVKLVDIITGFEFTT